MARAIAKNQVSDPGPSWPSCFFHSIPLQSFPQSFLFTPAVLAPSFFLMFPLSLSRSFSPMHFATFLKVQNIYRKYCSVVLSESNIKPYFDHDSLRATAQPQFLFYLECFFAVYKSALLLFVLFSFYQI